MPGQKYNGTGFPNGFRPDAKKPFDVRLVVDTTVDRNHVQFTYPGMPITVLGPPLNVAGITTYPQAKVYKLLADREPVFSGGPTTFDQDWELQGITAGNGSGYKGSFFIAVADNNIDAEFYPNLFDAALRASLKPGDFYKVAQQPSSQLVYNLDGITQLDQNDTVFWNGNKFDRFQNTNPLPINPLYKDTESDRFQDDLLDLIRLNALKEWKPARGYEINDFVKNSYTVNGAKHVDTWQALAEMNATSAALPTDTTPNPNWQLITTTNGAKLGGTALRADEVGRKATGAFEPETRSDGKYLSPEETDARIRQFGGQFAGPIVGGNAGTFLTADPTETPRN